MTVTTRQVADISCAQDLIEQAYEHITRGFTMITEACDLHGGAHEVELARELLALARTYCELAKQDEIAEACGALERKVADAANSALSAQLELVL